MVNLDLFKFQTKMLQRYKLTSLYLSFKNSEHVSLDIPNESSVGMKVTLNNPPVYIKP